MLSRISRDLGVTALEPPEIGAAFPYGATPKAR